MNSLSTVAFIPLARPAPQLSHSARIDRIPARPRHSISKIRFINFSHLLGTLALLVFYGLSSSPARAQEQSPHFAIGDHWTYHHEQDGVDRQNYTETVRALSADGTVDILASDGRGRQSIATYDGRQHRYLKRYAVNEGLEKGRILNDTSANEAPIRFPFAIADEWSVLAHYVVQGNPVTQEFKAKVVGKEVVKTPAGEFEAYKIELNGYWWNDETLSLGKGRQFETYWYAPAVKRFVRREIKSYGLSIAKMWTNLGYSRTDELVAYHVDPG